MNFVYIDINSSTCSIDKFYNTSRIHVRNYNFTEIQFMNVKFFIVFIYQKYSQLGERSYLSLIALQLFVAVLA